ncbi:hypothetical protein [Nocardioides sp. HDW12B]|uniref:hypothetical protein n=1 Tax=Nocardioides sp. HDW12B TaxID=2714939 RepID=UPI00197F6996|nr:hypothetical protein [Nocardioides sp. HDW12B]
MSAALLSATEVAEVTRPAGPAPLDQVVLATGVVVVASVALGALLLAHRSGRTTVLARLTARAEATQGLGGAAGWATVPLMTAMVSLITALIGMYWDIALHIGVGRDEGPLANPAHYPILIGLFGLSASGALACALPRGDEAGPAAVRVTSTWSMPVGGLLILAAGSYALLGFPLDDVWHRLFGQDVTLWGPTHLMLIGGAGLSLVGMAILLQEGLRARNPGGAPEADGSLPSLLRRVGVMGGMLIGLSVFQAEFDFGVPQFRLVLQPLLIAVAAALTLVAARMWIGRGGALAAVGFYMLVRGGVSLLVGPGLGELFAAVPLYFGEALVVEVAALVLLRRRPLAFGAVAGFLVGTVGFAAEFWWTRLVFPLPWTSDILVEGVALAVVGGVAGGVLGALLTLGLHQRLPAPRVAAGLFALSVLAISAATYDGLRTDVPDDLSVTLDLEPTSAATGTVAPEHVVGTVRFNRAPVDDEAAWVTVTAWQGEGSGTVPDAHGLHVEPLERVSATEYRLTEPAPVGGTWKTMVRVHDGRTLTAAPVFLPADPAIDAPEVPATAGETRAFAEEHLLLQRERKDGVAGWLWAAGGLVVLVCSGVLVLALGWGVNRYARSGGSVRPRERERVAS